jgi:hypothetical protein
LILGSEMGFFQKKTGPAWTSFKALKEGVIHATNHHYALFVNIEYVLRQGGDSQTVPYVTELKDRKSAWVLQKTVLLFLYST